MPVKRSAWNRHTVTSTQFHCLNQVTAKPQPPWVRDSAMPPREGALQSHMEKGIHV